MVISYEYFLYCVTYVLLCSMHRKATFRALSPVMAYDLIINSYTMSMGDLPDIYAQARGIYISGPWAWAYISGKSQVAMV